MKRRPMWKKYSLLYWVLAVHAPVSTTMVSIVFMMPFRISRLDSVNVQRGVPLFVLNAAKSVFISGRGVFPVRGYCGS